MAKFLGSIFILLAIARSLALAKEQNNLVRHETTEILPPGWKFHSKATNDEEIIPLRLALTEPNDRVIEIATLVSNPKSSKYGKYLDDGELDQLVHGKDFWQHVSPVKTWLSNSGAKDIEEQGEWLRFAMTLKQARQALNAKFDKYSFRNGQPVLRARSYDLPKELAEHIDFIYPVTQFLRTSAKIPAQGANLMVPPTGPPTCEDSVCPEQVRDLYKINYAPTDNKSGSTIGIAGFLEQYANHEDNKYFQANYANRTDTAPGFDVQLINGGENPQDSNLSGVEAMLDIEFSQAFLGQLNVTYFSTGGRPPTLNQHGTRPVKPKQSQNEPFLDFLQYLLKMKSPPQVISISYTDTEQTVPFRYAARVCKLFARLATRGVSVIGASGDGGASGTRNSDCKRPDGSTMFLPTFPPSCPWYTSVGAIASYGGAASFTSGGFSNYFGIPDWQKEAASGYIKSLGKKHSGFYNASGRGIPDVSLLGDDYLIWQSGAPSAVDGTSASTPVFAAIITLLNDLRLRAGKPVLGFLNPLLYSVEVVETFKDVKKGQSNGCADDNSFEAGWKAVKGWDPATGLGLPNFVKLRNLLV